MKNILYLLVALLVFTFALNTFDHTRLQLNEFSNICHSIYSEKVWIDTCNLPITQNSNTYELAEKLEFMGIVICGIVILNERRRSKGSKK